MSELSALIERHCHRETTPSAVPGLTLSRVERPTELAPAMYYPLFCVIARGRKRIFLGQEEFFYDPDCYLVASLDLPISGQILEAPCLGITLALDPTKIAALLLELPDGDDGRATAKAVAVNPLEDDLRDGLVRLLRLLDRPAEIPVLAPGIEREILYRLLHGPRGAMLRQMALPGSRLAQINRAVRYLREHYQEKIRTDALARAAGMSATSLHRHFRAVTAISPLQFQKRLRLQEARRLLLTHDLDASRVSFDVGYESASQFSREYARTFGMPPRRDAKREALRA